jgi:hypothetical protein
MARDIRERENLTAKNARTPRRILYVSYAFSAVRNHLALYQSTLTELITTAWTGTSWCMPRLPVFTFSIV